MQKSYSDILIIVFLLLLLGILNLPKNAYGNIAFLPFLFGGMLWTIRVNKNRELLIMRTSGLSLIHISIPIFLSSFL